MVENMSDVQRVLLPLFVRYGITRAVLFGSMAKGTATADSDVDLLGRQPSSWLGFLWLRGRCA